jgi:Nitroreductase family
MQRVPVSITSAIMDVYEAVTSRRAVRGFTDEPVSREVLERVLSAAAWCRSSISRDVLPRNRRRCTRAGAAGEGGTGAAWFAAPVRSGAKADIGAATIIPVREAFDPSETLAFFAEELLNIELGRRPGCQRAQEPRPYRTRRRARSDTGPITTDPDHIRSRDGSSTPPAWAFSKRTRAFAAASASPVAVCARIRPYSAQALFGALAQAF